MHTTNKVVGPIEKVVVGLATFRRPVELGRLLTALSKITYDLSDLVVIVVDNDPEGSAFQVVEAARIGCGFEIRYEIEASPGIAPARNRVVSIAADARYLAFIDDDETPEPGWLRELLSVRARFGADIVAGPVLAEMPVSSPAWLVQGGFFDRKRPVTGSEVLWNARTGNVLVDLRSTAVLGRLFEPEFNFIGCEDTHMFLRANRAGLKLVWADEAVCMEPVPAGRARPSWILKRALRGGTSASICEVSLAMGRCQRGTARLNRLVRGVAHVGLGSFRLVISGARLDRTSSLSWARRVCTGAGMVLGVFSIGYLEYARPGDRRFRWFRLSKLNQSAS